MKPTALYESALIRYQEVSKVYEYLEKRGAEYPEGKIHIVRHGDRVQYYLRSDSGDKSGKYISKREIGRISLYLQKKYDEAVLARLKPEIKILEKLLKIGESNTFEIRRLYSDNPEEIKNMIQPIDMSDEDYSEAWLSEHYERKEIMDKVPSFITNRGEHVRSKSELTIANALEKHGIPYKYECPLVLSTGAVIHPDFTILNLNTRQEVYWEHRGMMDDRDYARHAVKRVKELGRAGIVLGVNLIITEETANCPLGTDEIERIIRRFFGE